MDNKYYKLRKDLSIELCGHKLFRIEATKNLKKHNIKKGDLGGYIETKNNLYGNAWVCGNAKVYGNARVCGNAKVCGDAWVYGDKLEKRKDIYNITSNEQYNITILPNSIKIGCQYHTKEEWFNYTDKEIIAMDGKKALEWWRVWKPILKAICDTMEVR